MQNFTQYFLPNSRIAALQPSLIREMQKVKHLGQEPEINLGLGELPYPMPKAAQLANTKALKEGKNHYSQNAGLSILRQRIAEAFVKKHSVAVDAENVMVTAGSTAGLFMAFEIILSPGDEILIPEIHYPLYAMLAQKTGAEKKEYALHEDFSIDTNDLKNKITRDTKLLVLNSPSNPTGQILSEITAREIAAITKKFPSLFIISDEIYSSFVFQKNQHVSIAGYAQNVIVIDGLSKKASMTGKRLGWMIAPPVIIDQAVKMQQLAYTCAPIDAQYAAVAVLSGQCDTDLRWFQSELERKRMLFISEAAKENACSFTTPFGAFYSLLDISRYGTSLFVAKHLIEQVNVITIPGIAFGKKADRFLRISFAGSDTAMLSGVNKMKGVFQKWQQ